MEDGSRERFPKTEAGPNFPAADLVSWRLAGRAAALWGLGVLLGVYVVALGEPSKPSPLGPGLASVLGL